MLMAQRGGGGGRGGGMGGGGMRGGGMGGGGFRGGMGGGGFRGGMGGGFRGGMGGGFRGGFGFRGGKFNNFGFRGFRGFRNFNNFNNGFGFGWGGLYWPWGFSDWGYGSYWPYDSFGYPYSSFASYPYDYGYGYPSGYGGGAPAYAASPAQPSSNVVVIYGPQTPPQTASPVIREYDEYGQEVQRQPGPAPMSMMTAPPQSSSQAPLYLIAFTNHDIRAAVAYWVDGATLHYVSSDHAEHVAPLSSIDRDLSIRLNYERHVTFSLPSRQ
jgi:hypothetical protein